MPHPDETRDDAQSLTAAIAAADTAGSLLRRCNSRLRKRFYDSRFPFLCFIIMLPYCASGGSERALQCVVHDTIISLGNSIIRDCSGGVSFLALI